MPSIKVKHPAYLKYFFSFIEKDARKNGIKSISNFLKKIKLKPQEIILPSKTLEVLKEKPCILITNHPHYIEFLLTLTNIPYRKDIFIVITDSCLDLIPSLDKHLIPVHIQHHGPENVPKKIIDFGRIFFFTPAQKNIEESRAYNRKNIDLGVKKVNKGGILLICPQGLRESGGRWFDGIGFIVSKLDIKKDVNLINVYVKNTSRLDILRIIPFMSKFLPQLKIAFSQPFSFKKYLDKKPKEITKLLEKKYNNWSKSIF